VADKATLRFLWPAVILLFLSGCSSTPTPAPTQITGVVPTSAPTVVPVPTPPPVSSVTNTFYSGYEADLDSGSFSRVVGTWIQPKVTCSSTAFQAAFIWVGIQDTAGKFLEQAGSEADCFLGRPTYYTWYEMFPKVSVKTPLRALPGDKIKTEITVSGSVFTLRIFNLTTGHSFVTQQTQKASKIRAQWIIEAPSLPGRKNRIPLAKFSTIIFTSASATGNGHSGPILDRYWGWIEKWSMKTAGGTLKDVTSNLIGTNAFTATWRHY
jgi:hypothetical protein